MNRPGVPVSCLECGHRFPQDPVFEVACPTCGAEAGRPCVHRSPSGHVKNAEFAGLPAWGHDARDHLATVEGHYLHDCIHPPEVLARRRDRARQKLEGGPGPELEQADLFASGGDLPLFAGGP